MMGKYAKRITAEWEGATLDEIEDEWRELLSERGAAMLASQAQEISLLRERLLKGGRWKPVYGIMDDPANDKSHPRNGDDAD